MERRLIRKKWQVTIPRGIRRKLGLYEGQTINWQIVEAAGGGPPEVRIFPGTYALRDGASGLKEELEAMGPSKRRAMRRKIGISDTFISPRGRNKLRAIIQEVILDLGLLDKLEKDAGGNPPGSGDTGLN